MLATGPQLDTIIKKDFEANTSYTIDKETLKETFDADEKIQFDTEEIKPDAEDTKVPSTFEDDLSELLVEVQDQKDNDEEPDSPHSKRRLRSRGVPVVKSKNVKSKKVLKYIKGRTPKLLKPSKTFKVFDLLNEGNLSLKEQQFVDEQVSSSKIKYDLYNCSICSKVIHSSNGFRYHVVSRHVLRSDPQKAWVAQNLEAGHRISFIKGQKQESWDCMVCSKEFKSHPAIRYHLHRHIIEGDLKIDS